MRCCCFAWGISTSCFTTTPRRRAQCLNLALTSREKGENAIPMAGFPHHQLEAYLGKLIAAGLRVAICDQVEDPREAKGLVQRELTRIVSRGTVTDDALLDPRENNFLAALVPGKIAGPGLGRAFDRPFSCGAVAGRAIGRRARAHRPGRMPAGRGRRAAGARPGRRHADHAAAELGVRAACRARIAGQAFRHGHARRLWLWRRRTRAAIRAAGAIIDYLAETQKASIGHIDRLIPYRPGTVLEIDEATRRSLEISRTLRDGSGEGRCWECSIARSRPWARG